MAKNKYGAKKTIVNGIQFDSIAESDFYLLLLIKRKNKEIQDFEIQPKFVLLPAFEKRGKKYKVITYTGDFKILHNDGSTEIIDIKGFEPRDFPLRKKLFNYNYPDLDLTILAVCPLKYVKEATHGGFIEVDKLKKLRAAEKRRKGANSK